MGLVAQRITRLTTNQEIAGSIPAKVENTFEKYVLMNVIHFNDCKVPFNECKVFPDVAVPRSHPHSR